MRPYACHRLPSDFCNVALFVLQPWECERSLYSRQVAIGATQQKQRFFNLFCSFVFPFVENCNVAFLVFVFPIVETATLQSFVLQSWESKRSVISSTLQQGQCPENRELTRPVPYSFCVSWESERSLFSPYSSSHITSPNSVFSRLLIPPLAYVFVFFKVERSVFVLFRGNACAPRFLPL